MMNDDCDGAVRHTGGPGRFIIRHSAFLICALLILGGFVGLDRVFYERVSLQFSTPNPVDRDAYAITSAFWETIRYFGSLTGALVAYFVVLAIHPKSWRAANTAFVAVLAADTLGVLVKDSVCRLRPDHASTHLAFMKPFEGLRIDGARLAGKVKAIATNTRSAKQDDAPVSFPSGEATAAFALATALSLLFPRARPLLYTAAVLTALARVLAGAHYISDVTAGAVIGTFAAAYVFTFFQKHQWRIFL
jgi:membrane-associated phospholipid phosphatase